MLQDIFPQVYHCEYAIREPGDRDLIILQKGGQVLLSDGCLPSAAQIRKLCPEAVGQAFYLFSIDEQGYFSVPAEAWKQRLGDKEVLSGDPTWTEGAFSWENVMVLRYAEEKDQSFGGAVGWQLSNWYDLHRYCGRCGGKTIRARTERAIVCPSCRHSYYPRISPVVIIAIVDGERILLTRYQRGGYRRHALVAGFVEIGETLEDAVRREVMEEVGLKVKNIRYVESQPWPFSSSLIAGFYAEPDGDATIHLNADGGEELAEAVWVHRDEVEIEDNNVSLTWDMIRKFQRGTL